jgi:hypothetical protein
MEEPGKHKGQAQTTKQTANKGRQHCKGQATQQRANNQAKGKQ